MIKYTPRELEYAKDILGRYVRIQYYDNTPKEYNGPFSYRVFCGSMFDIEDDDLIYKIITQYEEIKHTILINDEDKTIRCEALRNIDFNLSHLITLCNSIPINNTVFDSGILVPPVADCMCSPLFRAMDLNMIETIKSLLKRPDIDINLGLVSQSEKIQSHPINCTNRELIEDGIPQLILKRRDVSFTNSDIDGFFEYIDAFKYCMSIGQLTEICEGLKKCVEESRFNKEQEGFAYRYLECRKPTIERGIQKCFFADKKEQ